MYNLLIVEDIIEIARALKTVIDTAFSNINVLIATNFDDACTLIQNQNITIDFFFFDIELKQGKEKMAFR